MVTSAAVVHGDRERLLGFCEIEKPLACQLGGSEPDELARAARIVEDWGYDEVNLNVGCPSDRVQSGRFGACLMLEPDLVADCVAAMKAAVSIPVTVKCRIGVDEQDTEEALDRLADAVVAAGTDALWVHARKAWLKGLSPKENRDIPPLDYARVYRLKKRLPHVWIGINGGIDTLEAAEVHLEHVDGVMLGRAAYHDPALLAQVDGRIYGEQGPAPDRLRVVEALFPYIERELARGTRLSQITRHILGLFQGVPGARRWRQMLSGDAVKAGTGLEVVRAACAGIDRAALDRADEMRDRQDRVAVQVPS